MIRRTNVKGDPLRNLQLHDGELQFEPGEKPGDFHSTGISTRVTDEGWVKISCVQRGVSPKSSVRLSLGELDELISHLTELRDSLKEAK